MNETKLDCKMARRILDALGKRQEATFGELYRGLNIQRKEDDRFEQVVFRLWHIGRIVDNEYGSYRLN